MKVAELSDALLDYWVARAGGLKKIKRGGIIASIDDGLRISQLFRPSTDWVDGGPIIERGNVSVEPVELAGVGPCWSANVWGGKAHVGYVPTNFYGPTPLIAAMRAFVASKFGEDVPDEVAP